MNNPTSSHFDPAAGPASLQPIDGPSAWIGAEMAASGEWLHRFTPAELEDLHQAMLAVRGRGLPILDSGKADFPLPTLGPVLEQMLDTVVNGRGFVLLRGLKLERYTIEEIATIYWGIGVHLGHPRSQNAAGHMLGHIRALGKDLDDPTARLYETTRRQTFHTDSCDLVALLCLHPARSGGLSSLNSSTTVYNEMVRRAPELAAALFEPIATDRRGEVPEGMQPWFSIPVFNEYRGYLSTIYQRQYITAAQRFPGVPKLTEAQIEAMDLFDALAEDATLRLDMGFEPGDIQVLHNHTVLHDRTNFEDWPEPERRRHLLRLWLAPPNARPLPPVYAERYGSVEVGSRGGVRLAHTRPTFPLSPE